ncbi:protein unc-93 homolog A [Suricata suricatta]|uniref:protein unc-93 homolog A n=1 Tax=Suricata suricatta TaxID=37032 RepID=UPI0011558C3E|nr:protein unc-93 homolog A [Suricata suricatta]
MERGLKNVLVVSFGFLLLFTAYGGLQSLQSSLYSEEGLGVTALSTLYGGMLLSSMLLPPLLIKKFGCKWTIVISMCCYVAFSLGNFYATWYTLIPTSVLLGLGAAPLWSAQCTYLTIMGNTHAEKAGKVGRDVVNQYFGIFFLIFQSSGVWGNLISSLVFGQTPTQGTIPEEQLLSCGASDCLMATAPTNSTQRPSQTLVYTLLGIYMGTCSRGPSPRKALRTPCGKRASSRSIDPVKFAQLDRTRAFSTATVTKRWYRAGLEGRENLTGQRWRGESYRQRSPEALVRLEDKEPQTSYTTCALGIQFVGYVMICFSAINSLCSVLYGRISKFTGRAALYALGAVVHLSCIVALLLWRPHPGQLALFFVFPGLWGVSDAVWQTQNNALFGVLFEKSKEAAFASYRLWEALGFVIAFGFSTFLCVSVKLYILLGVLGVAMLAYGTVEYLEARQPARPEPAAGEQADTAM